jgi:hypothetical protein
MDEFFELITRCFKAVLWSIFIFSIAVVLFGLAQAAPPASSLALAGLDQLAGLAFYQPSAAHPVKLALVAVSTYAIQRDEAFRKLDSNVFSDHWVCWVQSLSCLESVEVNRRSL